MDREIQVTWFRIENPATPYQQLANGEFDARIRAWNGDTLVSETLLE